MPRMTKQIHDAMIAKARGDGFEEALLLLDTTVAAGLSPAVAAAALRERLDALRREAEDLADDAGLNDVEES